MTSGLHKVSWLLNRLCSVKVGKASAIIVAALHPRSQLLPMGDAQMENTKIRALLAGHGVLIKLE